MPLKSPRFVKPYPRQAGYTGIKRLTRSIIPAALLRQPRPRRHARPWRYQTRFDTDADLESRAVHHVKGSLPERIVYKALLDYGLMAGIDFTFQASHMGGRTQLGGLVADFMFDVPKVIVQIQSVWHLLTMAHERRDDDQYAILQSMGYTVLEIWPETIEDSAALDHWLDTHIMQLWGTSTGGVTLGGSSSAGFTHLTALFNGLNIDHLLEMLDHIYLRIA